MASFVYEEGTLRAAAGDEDDWVWVHTESIPTGRADTECDAVAENAAVDEVDDIPILA